MSYRLQHVTSAQSLADLAATAKFQRPSLFTNTNTSQHQQHNHNDDDDDDDNDDGNNDNILDKGKKAINPNLDLQATIPTAAHPLLLISSPVQYDNDGLIINNITPSTTIRFSPRASELGDLASLYRQQSADTGFVMINRNDKNSHYDINDVLSNLQKDYDYLFYLIRLQDNDTLQHVFDLFIQHQQQQQQQYDDNSEDNTVKQNSLHHQQSQQHLPCDPNSYVNIKTIQTILKSSATTKDLYNTINNTNNTNIHTTSHGRDISLTNNNNNNISGISQPILDFNNFTASLKIPTNTRRNSVSIMQITHENSPQYHSKHLDENSSLESEQQQRQQLITTKLTSTPSTRTNTTTGAATLSLLSAKLQRGAGCISLITAALNMNSTKALYIILEYIVKVYKKLHPSILYDIIEFGDYGILSNVLQKYPSSNYWDFYEAPNDKNTNASIYPILFHKLMRYYRMMEFKGEKDYIEEHNSFVNFCKQIINPILNILLPKFEIFSCNTGNGGGGADDDHDHDDNIDNIHNNNNIQQQLHALCHKYQITNYYKKNDDFIACLLLHDVGFIEIFIEQLDEQIKNEIFKLPAIFSAVVNNLANSTTNNNNSYQSYGQSRRDKTKNQQYSIFSTLVTNALYFITHFIPATFETITHSHTMMIAILLFWLPMEYLPLSDAFCRNKNEIHYCAYFHHPQSIPSEDGSETQSEHESTCGTDTDNDDARSNTSSKNYDQNINITSSHHHHQISSLPSNNNSEKRHNNELFITKLITKLYEKINICVLWDIIKFTMQRFDDESIEFGGHHQNQQQHQQQTTRNIYDEPPTTPQQQQQQQFSLTNHRLTGNMHLATAADTPIQHKTSPLGMSHPCHLSSSAATTNTKINLFAPNASKTNCYATPFIHHLVHAKPTIIRDIYTYNINNNQYDISNILDVILPQSYPVTLVGDFVLLLSTLTSELFHTLQAQRQDNSIQSNTPNQFDQMFEMWVMMIDYQHQHHINSHNNSASSTSTLSSHHLQYHHQQHLMRAANQVLFSPSRSHLANRYTSSNSSTIDIINYQDKHLSFLITILPYCNIFLIATSLSATTSTTALQYFKTLFLALPCNNRFIGSAISQSLTSLSSTSSPYNHDNNNNHHNNNYNTATNNNDDHSSTTMRSLLNSFNTSFRSGAMLNVLCALPLHPLQILSIVTDSPLYLQYAHNLNILCSTTSLIIPNISSMSNPHNNNQYHYLFPINVHIPRYLQQAIAHPLLSYSSRLLFRLLRDYFTLITKK